ncbi:MAG: M48 family metalloprotease [Pseudomonadota bacterium]
MDFFKAQAQARKKTGRLVVLFGAAVLTLIVLTNALVAAVMVFSSSTSATLSEDLGHRLQVVPVTTWIAISLGVLAVVGIACGFKYLTLRAGGRTIAESLGGQRLAADSRDAKQRRLLNVVEEMAIASGLPVPPVYLIPEPSINAFAAGFGPDDAVLGFNQGTLDQLNREELQGVVAHEFSHLLNGDTRINLRLIALLHGILFLGLIGRILLRGSSRGGSRGGSGRGGGGAGAIVALGGGLMLIGYGGTFFGNLIKAAVSRQREYLADGSAVQFTRNPTGIAGALKKIGGLPAGALMTHPQAAEASHMLFGQGITHFLGSLMATHPPLPERIRAIEPGWDGAFTAPRSTAAAEPVPSGEPLARRTDAGRSQFAGSAAGTAADADSPLLIRDDHAAEQEAEFDVIERAVAVTPDLVGNPDDDAHDAAAAVLASTATYLREATHDPVDARALLFAMLMTADPGVREAQQALIEARYNRALRRRVQQLERILQDEDDLHRLALLQASLPALKESSRAQYRTLVAVIVALIKADAQIELFEWVLYRVLIKALGPHFDPPHRPRERYTDLEQVHKPCIELLSALAVCGNPLPGAQKLSFAAGMALLPFSGAMAGTPDPGYERLSAAVRELRKLSPLAKPKLLKACATVALSDELVTVKEGALLQGVSLLLDCPLPPAIYRAQGLTVPEHMD